MNFETSAQEVSAYSNTLPLMTLREVVMFPKTVMSLYVGRNASVKAVEAALAHYDKKILLVAQKAGYIENPSLLEIYRVGVVCDIIQLLRLPDGNIKVLFEGLYRAEWQVEDEDAADFPLVRVSQLDELALTDIPDMQGMILKVQNAFEDYSKINPKITADTVSMVRSLHQPGEISDALMPHLRFPAEVHQEILEILDPGVRIQRVEELLRADMSTENIDKRISARVKKQMESKQREYYLTEKIKAIHRELGQENDFDTELTELEQRLSAKAMPEKARERVLKEIRKMRAMQMRSPEYTVVRNYVDCMLDLPWDQWKEIEIDISRSRESLDAGHYGLERVKERILEYLAVQKLTDGLRCPVLCLVGPPGVGKTSLARSIADVIGRDFVRISLGGVRDEAEIRGHRSTYVGAMPGKLIRSLQRVGSSNPLILLDEIDKMSADFRGDPSAALLEVLDAEQNRAFTDHYVDMPYDLSRVFFIATANSLQSIPAPLLDRMELIELHGYLDTEKLAIARHFLIPRQLKEHGLSPDRIEISDDTVREIINSYTYEAGVRSLERCIAALCRKKAVKLLESPEEYQPQVSPEMLPDLLGNPKYRRDDREETAQTGVVAGMAYSQRGGDILYVETSIMPGSGHVSVTGQLGDVMKESASAALSYVRSRAELFGLDSRFHRKIDIHVHIPAGATPKDGPSAGVTMVTSLTSALLGIPVRSDVAMTGEISLRGRVLPVGGLREKLTAACRSGISRVLLPKDNEADVREVPEEVVSGLDIVYVQHIDEVLPYALAAAEEEIFCGRAEAHPLYMSLRKKSFAQAQISPLQ